MKPKYKPRPQALLVSFLFALLVALTAAMMLPRDSRAFEPGTWTSEEQRIFESLQKQSNVADALRAQGKVPAPEVEDAQKKARRVLTRSMRKAMPRLAPHLISKGGLAGVAAGVWIHNGVVIYNGYQCGRTDCPEPLVLDAEFRQATEEAAALGAGSSVFKSYGSNNFLVATGMVTGVEYRWDPASYTCSLSVTVAVQRAPGAQGYNVQGPGKNRPDSSPFASTICDFGPMNLGGSIDGEATIEAERQTFSGLPARDVGQYSQMYTVESSTGDYKRFGPPIYPYLSSSWKNPVYDVGNSRLGSRAPDANDHNATLEEGKAVVGAVKGDAEYDPSWAQHPWDRPDEPDWTKIIRPPGNPLDDERIFGPGTKDDRGGLGMVIYHFRDGTVGMYDNSGDSFYANGNRKVWRNADGSYNFAGANERFKGEVPLCDTGSTNVYRTVYPDGVTVDRQYPEGVTSEQTQTTQAVCENWRDAQGNPMEPADPAMYPKHFLKDYSQYL